AIMLAICTRRSSLSWGGGGYVVEVDGRSVDFWYGQAKAPGGWSWDRWSYGFFASLNNGEIAKHVTIPMWAIIAPGAMLTGYLWGRRVRVTPGTCTDCGYSRSGLPSGTSCPECGSNAGDDSPNNQA